MRIPHGLRAALAGQGTPAPSTDANFENTVLLLHGDGTNGAQNNTFTDGSTNNFTITRNGNTTQGTFSPYGDNWSNYFDGTGDFLSAPASSAFDFGSGAFTLEAWVYLSTVANNASVLLPSSYDGGNGDWIIRISAGGGAPAGRWEFSTWWSGTQYVAYSNTSASAGTWTHLAAQRNGNTFTLYVNGVAQTATATNTNTVGFSARTTLICGDNSSGVFLTGYVSNARIVKGTAVYTSNFTPSTTPLTAITNTSLLTCQSNRFRDASTNNFTITRNGDVSVQRFSPFSPAAAYSSSTIGGSGYFDGTGDYLQIGQNSAFDLSGDFTAEFWTYALNNYTSTYTLYIGTPSGSGDYFGLKNGQYVAQFAGSGEMFWTGLPPLGAWTHLALVRSGSTVTLYQNGVSLGTATKSSTWIGSSQNVQIGAAYSSLNVNAYISNLRIVKGTAVYTAAFTPPTSPVSAITNTSLLLNFTNGGIIDNTMMNDLETVGNAQISTSVKKFGTGSMYFDGTGDWLVLPHTSTHFFGTGLFTIECWLYLGAAGAARGVVGKGTSSTGWLLSTDSTNNVVFTYGTSTIVSSGSLSASTWYHIAIVREGTGTNQTKIYIDGTNDGTGTVNTNFNQTSVIYVGANRTGGDALNGYIDDLRITSGVARYTANFTPPTQAFPDL